MNVDLDYFLNKVLPFAPGCPEPTAFQHIVNAAQDFCEETKLWRMEGQEFELGEFPNVLAAPSDALVYDIERCDFNGRKLDPASIGWLDDRYPTWRNDGPDMWTGMPRYFTQTQPDTIRVTPAPMTEEKIVKVWARLKPADDAESLPDFIAYKHSNTIAWGALAKILLLPKQDFTDPERAMYFKGEFDTALGRASSSAQVGQQNAPIRTKANFF